MPTPCTSCIAPIECADETPGCNYPEPHEHGFACDKTCAYCHGKGVPVMDPREPPPTTSNGCATVTDLGWLDAIEARLAAATPGPWESEASKDKFLNAAAVFADCPCCGLICADAFDWDAEFIANAPSDIAHLVEALRDALGHIEFKAEEIRGLRREVEEHRRGRRR